MILLIHVYKIVKKDTDAKASKDSQYIKYVINKIMNHILE